MSSDDSKKRLEYRLKIVVIGEAFCGKTCILRQYVNDEFSEDMKATIGVDFYVKELDWDDRTSVRLQFWDIAGQERYGHMMPMFYREASGAFVVYDCSNDKTFDCTPDWKRDLDFNLGGKIPTILLGNKCDKPHTTKGADFINQFLKDNDFCGFFETSAKSGANIDSTFNELVKKTVEKYNKVDYYNY